MQNHRDLQECEQRMLKTRLWITLCHPKILHLQMADISLTIKCKERKPTRTAKFTLKLL